MEVVLKKSKITASILKQAVQCTRKDFESAEILGWCHYNKWKYIVCYRPEEKTISKYPVWSSVETIIEGDEQYGPVRHIVVVKYNERFESYHYREDDENECKKVAELFSKAKEIANAKGQFYI